MEEKKKMESWSRVSSTGSSRCTDISNIKSLFLKNITWFEILSKYWNLTLVLYLMEYELPWKQRQCGRIWTSQIAETHPYINSKSKKKNTVGCLFVLFMGSSAVQKLLRLIRSYLLIIFIVITLGVGSEKILLWFMSESVQPIFSSRLTFRSLIHLELIFVYGLWNVPISLFYM